jgi:hypothetical protein
MPYVDKTYYDGTYKGESVSEADFSKFEARAEVIIDELTSYRISDLSSESEDTQTRFKSAICAQIEYISENGIGLFTDDRSQSVGLGKFNYSKSSDEPELVAPLVYKYLNPTGLLYRGL